VTNLATTGNPQQQPITFTFQFSQAWNATTFDPANNLALAYVTLTSQGGTQLRLSFLGTTTYLPSVTAAQSIQIVSTGIIQPTDTVRFTFLDGSGNGWVDLNGDSFLGSTFTPFSAGHKPLLKEHQPMPRPIAPGVGGPKPMPRPTAH
jgi:hypothetical protein